MSKADLVIHPVRVAIIGAVGSRTLTPRQISAALPDIAQATLYRHLSALREAGILEVVGRRQAHGAVESTLALKRGSSHLSREEFAAISPEDHQAYLAILQGAAGNALKRYVAQSKYDSTEEGMTYFAAGVALDDERARQFRVDLLALVKRYSEMPAPEGRVRLITVSVIPEPKP